MKFYAESNHRTARTPVGWVSGWPVLAMTGLPTLVALLVAALLLAGCGEPEVPGAGIEPIASNDGGVLVKPPDLLDGSASAAEEAGDGAIESPATDAGSDDGVDFTWFDGTAGSLQDLVGRPTVVNFWASNCPPCIAEMPDFEAVHLDLGDQVAFVGINVADRHEAAVRLAERTGVTYRLASDPDSVVFRHFGGFVMPTTIFLAADGSVTKAWAGVLTDTELRSQIGEHLLPTGPQAGNP